MNEYNHSPKKVGDFLLVNFMYVEFGNDFFDKSR